MTDAQNCFSMAQWDNFSAPCKHFKYYGIGFTIDTIDWNISYAPIEISRPICRGGWFGWFDRTPLSAAVIDMNFYGTYVSHTHLIESRTPPLQSRTPLSLSLGTGLISVATPCCSIAPSFAKNDRWDRGLIGLFSLSRKSQLLVKCLL